MPLKLPFVNVFLVEGSKTGRYKFTHRYVEEPRVAPDRGAGEGDAGGADGPGTDPVPRGDAAQARQRPGRASEGVGGSGWG